MSRVYTATIFTGKRPRGLRNPSLGARFNVRGTESIHRIRYVRRCRRRFEAAKADGRTARIGTLSQAEVGDINI
jgi:hypothetical protein